MFLNASETYKYLKDPLQTAKLAQHGVDLTLKDIYTLTPGQVLLEKTIIGSITYLSPDEQNKYFLTPGVYGVQFEQGCVLPANVKANIIHRSSVLRNGSFILSGEYDPGFETEYMGAFLFVTIPIIIEKGARIAQIVMAHTLPSELYNGQFQRQ